MFLLFVDVVDCGGVVVVVGCCVATSVDIFNVAYPAVVASCWCCCCGGDSGGDSYVIVVVAHPVHSAQMFSFDIIANVMLLLLTKSPKV